MSFRAFSTSFFETAFPAFTRCAISPRSVTSLSGAPGALGWGMFCPGPRVGNLPQTDEVPEEGVDLLRLRRVERLDVPFHPLVAVLLDDRLPSVARQLPDPSRVFML